MADVAPDLDRLNGVRRPLPAPRRWLRRQARRRGEPGRDLFRHDHLPLGATAQRRAGACRDGRISAPARTARPWRLGRGRIALVGPRRRARGHVEGADAQRLPRHDKSFDDFVLKLSFQLVNGEGNSGVQFRSVRVPGHEMSGYQADIGQNYWGCLYDESRRNKVLVNASAGRRSVCERRATTSTSSPRRAPTSALAQWRRTR